MPESNLYGPLAHVTWLSANIRLDGIAEIRWAMPDGTVRTTNQMAAGPTLVMKMWDALDKSMTEIMEAKYPVDQERAKIRARAQAEFIALYMTPHFTTADSVAIEARKRYNARQKDTPEYDPEYETPGLGTRRYQPPPGTEKYGVNSRTEPGKSVSKTRKAPGSSSSSSKATRTGKKLPEDSLATIKQGVETGMFTVAQISKMYSVSEDEVKEQLGLASTGQGPVG
jgi:hypothetical protein